MEQAVLRGAVVRVVGLFAGVSLWASGANAALFDRNVVVSGNMTASSHVQGTTFVGGILQTMNQPIFGQSLTPTSNYVSTPVLTVKGDVTGSGLTMEAGIFRREGSLSGGFGLNLNGGSSAQRGTVDASLVGEISTASAYFASLASNSTYAFTEGKRVTFNANPNASGVAIFDLSAGVFTTNNLEWDIAFNGAVSVVINVDGNLPASANSGSFLGTLATNAAAKKVVWNFRNATEISLDRAFWGSIVAPTAFLTQNNQNIDGGVYVASLDSNAEIHMAAYAGLIPEPATTGLLAGFGMILLRRSRRIR